MSSADSEDSTEQSCCRRWCWWCICGSGTPEVDARDLQALLEAEEEKGGALQVVDVRTAMEYSGGHIRGARHCSYLPSPWGFRNAVSEMNLDKQRPVYLICLSAHRSISAQRALTDLGFEHAIQLKGGMQAWRKHKLPEVTDDDDDEKKKDD